MNNLLSYCWLVDQETTRNKDREKKYLKGENEFSDNIQVLKPNKN